MRLTPLARPLTALAAAVLVTGVLAGCTGVASAEGCTPEVPSGDTSLAVTATGEVGTTPEVTMPTPLIAEEPQRSVAVQGEGAPIIPGSGVLVNYVYYDGTTGSPLTQSTAVIAADERNGAFGEALVCATAGSRLVVAGPANETVVDQQYATATATIVVVADVVDSFLGKADGFNQLPLDGMPTVVTAVDGTPGLALGYQSEVDEPRASTIKAGGGAVVGEDDTVVFHVRSFTWSAPAEGQVATQARVGNVDSWTAGRPFAQPVSVESIGDETIVETVIGSKVGSQLLIVIPDGTGGATAFVFDILGLVAAE